MVESWYFGDFCFIFEIFNIMVPLKIPTPTPAPDLGCPVACLSGLVACLSVFMHTCFFLCCHYLLPSLLAKRLGEEC